MHFNKRLSTDDDNDDDHLNEYSTPSTFEDNLMKRGPNRYIMFGKKAGNRFMHFGKRSESKTDEELDLTASKQAKLRKRRLVKWIAWMILI